MELESRTAQQYIVSPHLVTYNASFLKWRHCLEVTRDLALMQKQNYPLKRLTSLIVREEPPCSVQLPIIQPSFLSPTLERLVTDLKWIIGLTAL